MISYWMNLHNATWIECNSTEFNLNSNFLIEFKLNEIYIEFNSIQFKFLNWSESPLNSTCWMFSLKFQWIEFGWIESNSIRLNTNWLN
jgi:hypothetical protein